MEENDNGKFGLERVNVGPAPQTVDQHWNNNLCKGSHCLHCKSLYRNLSFLECMNSSMDRELTYELFFWGSVDEVYPGDVEHVSQILVGEVRLIGIHFWTLPASPGQLQGHCLYRDHFTWKRTGKSLSKTHHSIIFFGWPLHSKPRMESYCWPSTDQLSWQACGTIINQACPSYWLWGILIIRWLWSDVF